MEMQAYAIFFVAVLLEASFVSSSSFLITTFEEECERGEDINYDCSEDWDTCNKDYNETKNSISLYKPDSSSMLEVSFQLANYTACCHKEYKVQLHVAENVSKDECPRMDNLREVHSTKIFETKPCTEKILDSGYKKTANVTFNYIYSACYQVRVIPKTLKGTREPMRSSPVFISSSYVKDRIIDHQPVINVQYFAGKRGTISVTVPTDVKKASIELLGDVNLALDHDACFESGIAHLEYIHVSDDLGCQSMTDIPDLKDAECCSEKGNVVTCIVEGVKPGNYCIKIELLDDRCASDTVWLSTGEDCLWYKKKELKSLEDGNNLIVEDHSTKLSTPVLAGFSVFLAFAVVSCIMSLYFCRRRRHRKSLGLAGFEPPKNICQGNSIVLLVYSRDCRPFMNLMRTLKEAIEERCSCIVYDCFDWSLFDQISVSPNEWMQSHIGNRNVKIVLVATELGYRRHTALMSGKKLRLCEPHVFDDLFVSALKAINIHVYNDLYDRIFIVRFDGFTEEDYLYTYINPFERFVLLQHTEKLLLRICPDLCSHETMMEKLRIALGELVEFKNKKPRYLTEMLMSNLEIIT